jgi:hypothetical protein
VHGMRTSGLRRTLVALQAAFAVILLVGAGLFLESLHEATNMDFGVDLRTVALTFEKADGFTIDEGEPGIVYAALDRLRAHPDVESAAVTTIAPFSGSWGVDVALPGKPSLGGPGGPYFLGAGGDYFHTVGMRILEGRGLTEAEDRSGARVAVVSRHMADALWPGQDPLGKCYIVRQRNAKTPQCTTVVGVAADYIPQLETGKPALMHYLPPHHPDVGDISASTVLVRLKPGARTTPGGIGAIARAASPGIRFVETSTLRDLIAPQLRSWELGAALLTAFGILALIVAAAGLYSVLAFEVAQRRFELGLRSALGASALRISGTLLHDVLRTTALGIMAGIAVALALGRVTRAMLFHVQPADPWVYLIAVGTMLLLGMVAAAVPMWRALRVSPRIALAGE